MHEFGAKVDKVVAPTTREHGTKAAMELGVLSREQEERKNSRRGDGLVLDPAKKTERDNAIKELENEKKQMYDDLKSSLGESEADAQIKLFMVSRETTYVRTLIFIVEMRLEWAIQAAHARDKQTV